uniref:Uncharacterized protein n=1 Tax=Triticum urartu TaxID=4572 RepID=A0A8R7U5Q6_TRIUA
MLRSRIADDQPAASGSSARRRSPQRSLFFPPGSRICTGWTGSTKVKGPFMTSMALAPCSGISTDVIAAAVEIENLNLAWSSESAGA